MNVTEGTDICKLFNTFMKTETFAGKLTVKRQKKNNMEVNKQRRCHNLCFEHHNQLTVRKHEMRVKETTWASFHHNYYFVFN